MEFADEHLLRELAPQVLGVVVRRFGDFSAAEDAVQEALTAAAVQWPREGVPDNPRAWIIHVALRRMSDHVRAELARRRRETAVVMEAPRDERAPAPDGDDSGEEDELNHAIAAAMVHGAAFGLELLKALDADARLAGHHRLDAVRAHLFEKAGDHDAAVTHYRAAANRTSSLPERNYLLLKAARLAR